ncbi:DUF4249 domain-containing protein [Aurantibacter crassamenti]|uniref:DUF4249 domain-containing protein n=1 Tax=Aurantibacter crassamenti TaxID=1837375 RepID=UPI001939F761|nr:DUF4249 domain-containing protein [Aurantibacter crassamenti]MBM1104524.1 DUF4249 domain-containing protein [Aurantibacter crassamenti]
MVFKRLYLIFLLFFIGCITPEEPKFEYKEGLIYIDAFASTSTGASYVNISESVLRNQILINVLISGATIFFTNTDSGQTVELTEENGQYVPPSDFAVAVGETWDLKIELPNGKKYYSQPETIIKPVAFTNLKATYNPELTFKVELNEYVPGHALYVDLNDPLDERNYYLWKFRTYEKLLICETCDEQIFRNGRCIEVNHDLNKDIADTGESDYYCDGDCWRIRYNETIELFSDEFVEGGIVQNLPVGDIQLYTTENLVVEVQQLSLTENTYDYYKVLKDIVDNNSGLNAPPPAALVGNMYNPEDEEEYVLGRFTAASSTTNSLYITRESIEESPLDPFNEFTSECEIFCGIQICHSPEGCAFESIVPCSETRYRTAIKPEGWID